MRKSGVLMHVTSLPSPYGIGTLGAEARHFIDFLAEAGQTYWQILPVCSTSYGDSPYQSFSTFAGNPYFIDLDLLEQQGYLKKEEYQAVDWQAEPQQVNFGAMYQLRYPILHKAAERFLIDIALAEGEEKALKYQKFCQDRADWLDNYALFMALKDYHEGKSWLTWDPAYRCRNQKVMDVFALEHADDIEFWKVVQYFFTCQWEDLRSYAEKKHISIIGDLPIYVALDSADVWANPDMFQLDENLDPISVAGCPPDAFTADGQLWGNPLYRWDVHEKTGFQWWIRRIRYQCSIYHVLRIDHFRGFDSYYAIPYGEKTAKNGVWEQGPGMKLFDAIKEELGEQNIIAEDLGFLTDSVRQLLADSGYPGMRVMEFAFDNRDNFNNEHLPYNYVNNCVAYIGTHDNDTALGWITSGGAGDTEFAKNFLHITDVNETPWRMIDVLWSSVADTVIVQAQDLLGVGSEGRMNTPSTLGGNWCWRALPGAFTPEIAARLRQVTHLYGRL
jgi:4-alpha-glucanotransferase